MLTTMKGDLGVDGASNKKKRGYQFLEDDHKLQRKGRACQLLLGFRLLPNGELCPEWTESLRKKKECQPQVGEEMISEL